MKKVFISFLLIVAFAITSCSTEPPDDPNAKFIKGENGDWIFNFTADEFIEEWTNFPQFEGSNFETGSGESSAWIIDEDNVHILLYKDSKNSKVCGFYIITDYHISVEQYFLTSIYSMLILKYLDEDLGTDKSVYEQILDAQNTVSNHEEEEVRLIIGDYEYKVFSKGEEAFMVSILPNPD